MAETLAILKGVTIDDSGQASMDLRDWSIEDIVMTICKVFDSLIEVSAITKGDEEAYEQAKGSVLRIKKQFKAQFESFDIEKHILKGGMREVLDCGIGGVDKILGGGIPKGNTILLLGPPGSEKYIFAYQFVIQGLREGASCLVTTSVTDHTGLKNNLSKLKIKPSTFESKGHLKTVDWYTYKKKNVVGVEDDGNVYWVSKDITNLDIAIGAAINKLSFAPTRRAMLDIISPALNIYDQSSVIEFVQREKNLLKKNGFTTMLVVESGAHDERTISTLKHLSDGVLVLEKGGKGKLTFKVEALSGMKFNQKTHQVKVTKKGLEIVSGGADEGTVLKDFLEIPAINKNMAKKLYDFGFNTLDKLEKAKKTDLTQVSGVNKATADNIYEYVHSVEYSKKIVERKSQVWLRKGMEFAKAGNVDKSMQSFQRAIEIDTKNSAAWFEMARLLYDAENVDDARQCFEKAVALDPGLSSKWFDEAEAAEAGWGCPVCGYSIGEEMVDCPSCGISFTIDERKNLRENA